VHEEYICALTIRLHWHITNLERIEKLSSALGFGEEVIGAVKNHSSI
jgi:hypothetical protein